MSVCAMQTAEEALTRAALYVPDLAIIEMELVDSSGTEVCRRLREWSSMPLIVVSHVSDEGPIRTYPGVGYLLEVDATRPSTERPTPEAGTARPQLLRAA